MAKSAAININTIDIDKRSWRMLTPDLRREARTAYLMILPEMIMLIIFVYYPLVMSVDRSFTDWQFYLESPYIGLQNYKTVLMNQTFQQGMINIVAFVAMLLPVNIIGSFLLAHALKNVSARLTGAVKSIVYLPSVVGGMVISMMGTYLFNYQGGLINFVLVELGFPRIAFTNDIFWARFLIVSCTLWGGLGSQSLIMLNGLNSIPQSYYESARLDGANALQQMWYITLPNMKNLFVLQIIGNFTATLQMFDLPNMLTGGGPLKMTTTPVLHVYATFTDFSYNRAYSVAASLLIMVIISALNIIVFKIISSDKALDD